MKSSVTTVKVDNGLYESFKIQNVKSKFHLQDLVNRAMYLYLNDREFKDRLYNFSIPVLSEEAQVTKLSITGSTR